MNAAASHVIHVLKLSTNSISPIGSVSRMASIATITPNNTIDGYDFAAYAIDETQTVNDNAVEDIEINDYIFSQSH